MRIQEKIKASKLNRFVFLGDFNPRYGTNVRELPVNVSYSDTVDLVRIPNDNEKVLVGISRDEHLH